MDGAILIRMGSVKAWTITPESGTLLPGTHQPRRSRVEEPA